jgi:ubiquinone/menaquinone biosynthesis C-methylase UbiE
MIYWHEGVLCCNERWEAAYNRFESPEQERRKFRQRFEWLGIGDLPRETQIVDLFCGSGNGLIALHEMGFHRLTGVDLSPELLARAPGYATRIVADCTDLKFAEDSVDAFMVQGGLHHLPRIPDDVEKCLDSVLRSLRPGGYFFVVEPWETLFLKLVHGVTSFPPARKLVPKFDAFATMIEEESTTYRSWLSQPEAIREAVEARYVVVREQVSEGKWMAILKKAPA